MPLTIFRNTKGFATFVLAAILLFLSMVYFQNQTTIVVTMEASDHAVLRPQIYYAAQREPFSGSRSSNVMKIEGNRYYFSLPDPKTIENIRLDPSSSAVNTIGIKNIEVIQSKWFRKTIYELSLKKIEPMSQIKYFQVGTEGVQFSSTGNDPQLMIHFSLKEVSVYTMTHFNLLFISFLVLAVCFYLYSVFKTQTLNDFLVAKLILYSLFFALAIFKAEYYKEHVKFGFPPDELAHLSYIDYIDTYHEPIPQFEKMSMVNNHYAGNYLSHPPLYYWIMDLVYDHTLPLRQNVEHFRSLSILIFLLSFLLLLYLGFSANLSLLAHFTYLSFIGSIPMYAYLGGSISNDTLAILGAIVFIIGMKRLIEEDYGNSVFFILGIGIFLSYFSKLTAAVLIFFASLYYLVYAVRKRQMFKVTKYRIAILGIFILPILYYQLYILHTYHSLMPTFNVTHPEQYLHSGFFVPEKYRHYLTHLEWFGRMKHYIVEGWFGIHSHHSFVKNTVFGYIGLLFMHIFALIALFIKCKGDDKSYCLVGKIALLSLLSVLVVQYFQSYQVHLRTGYLGGLQPRYLLPFMFSFAIMASLFVERFKQFFWWNIIVILICLQVIYSDFFYFLEYYV